MTEMNYQKVGFFSGDVHTRRERNWLLEREESSAYQPLEDGGRTTVISIASV